MSLGLPEFGSRGKPRSRGPWRFLLIAGILVFAYVAVITAIEWRRSFVDNQALERARADAASARREADDGRHALQKNADLLVAVQSLESSPVRVMNDLEALLPAGVAISSLKVDYSAESLAHVDFNVIANTPEAYDRFLSALSKSPAFSDIKPGSESRPGLVRAVVAALHRPAVKTR